jgi:hypothetical protein
MSPRERNGTWRLPRATQAPQGKAPSLYPPDPGDSMNELAVDLTWAKLPFVITWANLHS